MSGDTLGKLLDPPVSKQTITHWEKERYRPNVDQLEQLCGALRISADALILGATGTLSPSALRWADTYDRFPPIEQERMDRMLKAAGPFEGTTTGSFQSSPPERPRAIGAANKTIYADTHPRPQTEFVKRGVDRRRADRS